MSSFRPDSNTASPDFVAQALGGLAGFCAVAGLDMPLGGSDSVAEANGEVRAEMAERISSEVAESAAGFSAEELAAAEQAGFERGVASVDSARQELERSAAALEGSATALRDGIETRWNDWIAGERDAIVEIASDIAEQWVRGSLEADVTTLASMLDATLADVADSEPERLYLSADDLERLKQEKSEGRLTWEPALDIESDLQLASGEFRIALRHGWIDGRFEQIRHSLRERWAEHSSLIPVAASSSTAEDEA